MRPRLRFLRPAVILLLAAAGAAALSVTPSSAADRGTIVVTMGDGSTVTLRNWSLSYEYSAYKQGSSPLAGNVGTCVLVSGSVVVSTPPRMTFRLTSDNVLKK